MACGTDVPGNTLLAHENVEAGKKLVRWEHLSGSFREKCLVLIDIERSVNTKCNQGQWAIRGDSATLDVSAMIMGVLYCAVLTAELYEFYKRVLGLTDEEIIEWKMNTYGTASEVKFWKIGNSVSPSGADSSSGSDRMLETESCIDYGLARENEPELLGPYRFEPWITPDVQI